jgi:hypothetical protein
MEVGIGLPLEVFVAARDQVRPWVEGVSCQVAVNDRPAVPLVIRRVSVFPQAGGAYLHALLREDGQIRDRFLLEVGVGVIYVGYRTTDLLMLARTSEGMVPDADRCTTIDQGISAIYEHVWKVLRERIGEPVDIAWVERAFLRNRGVLTFRGEPIDLEPDPEVAREALANQITARVKRLWRRAAGPGWEDDPHGRRRGGPVPVAQALPPGPGARGEAAACQRSRVRRPRWGSALSSGYGLWVETLRWSDVFAAGNGRWRGPTTGGWGVVPEIVEIGGGSPSRSPGITRDSRKQKRIPVRFFAEVDE